MGGSIAQSLQGKVGQLIGVDRHAATRQQALADGVVDIAVDSLAAGIARADIILLATPVHSILQILRQLPQLRPDGCLVIDIGSTKVAINEAMSELPATFAALGGHPMCGKETAGYQAADPTLFQDKTFILTRNRRTTPAIEEVALTMVDFLGARPLFLPAQRHDQIVAAVSHMPYLLSATLMHLFSDQSDEHLWQISSSGFRDVSRLAGSDPGMLLDILLTNRSAVLDQLSGFQQELNAVIELLASADNASLADWLSEAQHNYAAYRQAKMPPNTRS